MSQLRTQSPLDRVRRGAIVLSCAVLLGVLAYHFVGGYEWIEAIYMVVITISSVGYGERSQLSDAMQLVTVALIMVGITSAAYTFTGFMQLVFAGELERTLGIRRMNRQIDQLTNHVIICGMGRSGRNLAEDLQQQGRDFVSIELKESLVEESLRQGLAAILGDATEESVLQQAGVDRAHALVSALPSDADNVFITLTARHMNPGMLIIARAEQENTARKLYQAGAQKVVMPARVSAMQMARMIVHPSTADLMELVAERSNLDVELDELCVRDYPALSGKSVRQTEAHRQHKLLVIAVRQGNGKLFVNPDADYVFETEDIAILMGSRKQIDQFRRHHQ